jgi:hypothetical protein
LRGFCEYGLTSVIFRISIFMRELLFPMTAKQHGE